MDYNKAFSKSADYLGGGPERQCAEFFVELSDVDKKWVAKLYPKNS